MIDTITQQYVTRLTAAGITGAPCDEWEVRDLEQQLRVTLPTAFKAFLLVAGKYFDPFVGSQYILGHDGGDLEIDPAEVQRRGERIFRRDGHALPSNAFVFFTHHGTATRFLLLDGSDDPAVFEYVEHEPPSRQLASSFSAFLVDEVRLLQEQRAAFRSSS
jgi:hypothetical protein